MSSYEVTVLIADDEAPARKRLKTLLSNFPNYRIIAEAENGDQVLKMVIEKSPQVVFLDINMPGASVFTTIPSLKNPPLIIFQTAYSEYGAKAFDINAVDYLLKPVSRERFSRALEKLSTIINPGIIVEKQTIKDNPRDVISIKSGEAIRVVKVDKISRISFDDGFSFIYTLNEKLYSDRTLNSYEEILENKGFYRISRTDIINLQYINKLHPLFKGQYIVEMLNGEKINISRRRIQGLKELIN